MVAVGHNNEFGIKQMGGGGSKSVDTLKKQGKFVYSQFAVVFVGAKQTFRELSTWREVIVAIFEAKRFTPAYSQKLLTKEGERENTNANFPDSIRCRGADCAAWLWPEGNANTNAQTNAHQSGSAGANTNTQAYRYTSTTAGKDPVDHRGGRGARCP